jgi:hypothetical protein
MFFNWAYLSAAAGKEPFVDFGHNDVIGINHLIQMNFNFGPAIH